MVTSPKTQRCDLNVSHTLDKACDDATVFLAEYGAPPDTAKDMVALLHALVAPTTSVPPDPVTRSWLAMIIHNHLWQYWYFDGIPLAVRVAYWAAVNHALHPLPEQHKKQWPIFLAHLEEIKAREIAIRRSEMAGGWLFPGEPQILWEIAKLACVRPGSICELGSWTGRSTTVICGAVRHFARERKVLLLDNWSWGYGELTYPFMTEGRDIRSELQAQLEPYIGMYSLFDGLILDQLTNVKSVLGNERLALLFHDASHEYDHVLADLSAYLPLVCNDGYIVVHDYNHPENQGTKQAVDELIAKRSHGIYRESVFNTLGIFRKAATSSAPPQSALLATYAAIGTSRTLGDSTR